MHIAICDDNVADRKQMERLLARESDKRKGDTGVFYVSSFGNPEVLGKSPMQYNLFFIDMVAEEPDGLAFAMELVRAGVAAPIVLCVSSVDYESLYRQLDHPPENISFIEKPIRTAELSFLLDDAIARQAELPPVIELRTEKETLYLQEKDIVCACNVARFVEVSLADGRVIQITDTLANFYDQVFVYSAFFMISKKAFINVNYIDKCTLLKVTLQNGRSLMVSPEFSLDLKKYLRQQ